MLNLELFYCKHISFLVKSLFICLTLTTSLIHNTTVEVSFLMWVIYIYFFSDSV